MKLGDFFGFWGGSFPLLAKLLQYQFQTGLYLLLPNLKNVEGSKIVINLIFLIYLYNANE